MKKILIVNNNMKIGGVQKSLCNLLCATADQYDITLLLFAPIGDYLPEIPQKVHVISCDSLFRFLGVSQEECSNSLCNYFTRGMLACFCKLFRRKTIMPLLMLSQEKLKTHYDCAISYLQNGNPHHFYGGVNEFVLEKVSADRKIAFLHCDYMQCGANNKENNIDYEAFDLIAACSDGCRKSFVSALPELAKKSRTVPNFHQYEKIEQQANENPYRYAAGQFHVIMVSRLAHEKGIERAILAVSHAREKNIPVVLHIIGDGPKENDLHSFSQKLGLDNAVLFHGSQKNPYRFMRNADFLMITSLHEAAPMVIDEACALALPILSVKTTSSDEMILKRACGWVCENEQRSLNEALVSVLNNPEQIEMIKERLRSTRFNNEKASAAFAELCGSNYE